MELDSIVRRKDGTGAEHELCQVISTQSDPTATLRTADGMDFHWSQRLTRPATEDEQDQFRRARVDAKPKIELQTLDTDIAGQDETRVIAIVQGEFVGIVAVQFQDRTSSCIRQLFVHPHKRLDGIGRALVEECARISREAECQSMGALIESNNSQVIGFYLKLGFDLVYQYPDDSGTGLDAIMSLKL